MIEHEDGKRVKKVKQKQVRVLIINLSWFFALFYSLHKDVHNHFVRVYMLKWSIAVIVVNDEEFMRFF